MTVVGTRMKFVVLRYVAHANLVMVSNYGLGLATYCSRDQRYY